MDGTLDKEKKNVGEPYMGVGDRRTETGKGKQGPKIAIERGGSSSGSSSNGWGRGEERSG